MYKRIIIKLSGEALALEGDKNKDKSLCYDKALIGSITEDILNVVNEGTQVALVVGGGNIWRGKRSDPDVSRVRADHMGMLATVINGIYLADFINSRGGKAVVMTPFEAGNMTEVYSVSKAIKFMEEGYILIFSGGLGHPFFSTDTIPVLRALELDADCIFFAKNIDGIYDKDPRVHTDAVKYKEITYKKIIEDNLDALDLSGMILCQENQKASLVFALDYPKSIYTASKNNDELYKFGTKILN